MKMLSIHAHDLREDSRPDFVQRVGQGYGAIVAQLQWIAFLVQQQCMALLPVVWGVTCHPHQDEHLVYGLLHGLRQIPQDFNADTIRARGLA